MTEAQFEELFEWMAAGNSCLSWCRKESENKEEPNKYQVALNQQIYVALRKDPQLAQNYAHAKAHGIEARLDRAREVACSEPDVQRARLITDLDKWEASKLLPKKYGDRQTIALEEVTAETLLEALKKESK